MDRQCSSCGGFCKKSGCERENVATNDTSKERVDKTGEYAHEPVVAMHEGKVIRDAQLNLFEQRDADFLARARALAVQICQQQGNVSINDIRKNLALPAEMHPSVLGAVFKGKQFKAVGFTEANHPQAHARIIRIYQLKESFNGQQSHA